MLPGLHMARSLPSLLTGLGFGATADGWSALYSDVIGASSTTPGTLTVYVTLDGAQLRCISLMGECLQ
jgi:hypothetical protein